MDLQLPGLLLEGLHQGAVQGLGLGNDGGRRPQTEEILRQGDEPGAPGGRGVDEAVGPFTVGRHLGGALHLDDCRPHGWGLHG